VPPYAGESVSRICHVTHERYVLLLSSFNIMDVSHNITIYTFAKDVERHLSLFCCRTNLLLINVADYVCLMKIIVEMAYS
jgi:hypothetical protein